jgi:hypothetical protein
MPRTGPVGAAAAGLVAAQILHREGPPAHRLGLGQLASELPDGDGRVVAIGHRPYFALV